MKATKKILSCKKLKKKKNNNVTNINEKNIEPTTPEYVLFGLILVNFGPLNNLPNTNPPISDATHPIRRIKSKIFTPSKTENKKNV